MHSWAQIDESLFFVFTLVLSRVSGFVMTAPLFSARDMPRQIRALLAVGIALLITPLQSGAAPAIPGSLVGYIPMLLGELLIGLVLGMGLVILMSGIQLAGQIISQISGLSLADIYNPSLDATVPLFSELLYLVSLAVFLSLGGHRLALEALLDTFAALPPGIGPPVDSIHEAAISVIGQAFDLGIRIAAPTVAAQLMATIVLGLVSRTLPQLNVLALGFGLNSLVTFGTLWLSLGAMAWAFQEDLVPALATIVESLGVPG